MRKNFKILRNYKKKLKYTVGFNEKITTPLDSTKVTQTKALFEQLKTYFVARNSFYKAN